MADANAADFDSGANAATVVDLGVNTPLARIQANIAHNNQCCYLDWRVSLKVPETVVLLAGGPSTNDFEPAILNLYRSRFPIITMNGSYHWAKARGITPTIQCVMDARPHNARFTQPALPDCQYLLANQCDPSVFEGLNGDHIYLWGLDQVLGGSTVMLNLIPMLMRAGARYFHVFGFDSCCLTEQHHAYEQSENDGAALQEIEVDDVTFRIHAWMGQQAEEFLELRPRWQQIKMFNVYGQGLIAKLLE